MYSSNAPNDGFYNVSSNTNWFGWHDIVDHTTGDTDGRMLVLNADFTSGEFYRTAISGLCENTTYEFSSWMVNLLPSSGCGGVGIPINVKFEIWDSTDTNLLASGDTGNINGTSSPNWQQYALVFQTLPGQSSVILKMLNNGVGGCGNDLALDDIVFKSCGDSIVIEDNLNTDLISICEDELPYSTTLTATPDFTIFSSHFYQWQESTDGINWVDIVGETNNSYVTLPTNNTTFYRVKVAEDVINVNNDSCNSSSETYEIRVVPNPISPISNGYLMICEDDSTPLTVTVPAGVMVNWYDANVGGNLLIANSTSYNPSASGIYYAEAQTIDGECVSASRTAMQIDYFEIPEVTDETLEFCENTSITLHANATDPGAVTSYLWNNGSVSEQIDISNPGTYSVVVSNNTCSITKTIIVSQIDNPILEGITSKGTNIIITPLPVGDFLYSIDGTTFQTNPVFLNIEGGQYTIYVKHQDCNQVFTTQHIHFYIPEFFTPNGDTINDTFNLKGIEFFSFSQVSIFDRYGKLIKNGVNTNLSWDGTLNGELLPTGDYWYIITIEGQKFTGHVTLKR
ncbi:T9SS type B sorting domain-containing protein [uncultured Algibacter sp.]|uniref:T9SS type B sorting domain-containing protein n=1 Tax=uncultured Algibacter sp. TaxID=298659 RepID=UPI002633057B|nr:T9SS type B sorting domain-containing protein [uncultured Algibacter sp.]